MSDLPTVSVAIRSPFARLADLLGDAKPGEPPIALSVGEPQHAIPDFVGPVLAVNLAAFNRYPTVWGSEEFRKAVADWAGRRFPGVSLDPAREVMVLSGSREGLFSATLAATAYGKTRGRRRVAMPNPFYPPYAASARAAQCTPILLEASADNGFLPDFDRVPAALLDDTVCAFLCSPANPQGAVASRDHLRKAIDLARQHGFLLFVDECYSEIYADSPPPGGLEVAAQTGSFANVVVFNSLSKRSNLAGLRIGFVAGDAAFLAHLAEFRNVTCPQVPLPVQAVAVAAYGDESHVAKNRDLYRAKFTAAQSILGNRFGPVVPAGGFFLWLDVRAYGSDEDVALKLWRGGGLRVVPGRYLAADDPDGGNPGAGYIRVALVHDQATIEGALTRLAAILD